MANPTIIDIPHSLGREEAKRRIGARIGELPGHIPGGVAEVQAAWPAEDRMAVDVKALGQSVSAMLDVQDAAIRVTLRLPPMLSFFSGTIADAVSRKGAKLLLAPPEG
ncbi:polyhydroxyalkanoic acid system family protein [Sphingomonas profundi]|uniref:polyhydroxyalkanoic acid system family protein n=1 Tax=Alterirhizorhabdus profundi TaxID=2681549 RepID=UPI0012E98D43|nr:polyhydroxyalkanoic acid system family protein [Sphingomonas profundi]